MLILAHRGLAGTGCTENTVPAVLAALDAGADGVHVDLRLSADGVLVACHDADLQRVAGAACVVHRTGWAELHAAAAGAGVPLARVEWVLAAAAGRRVVLQVAPVDDAARGATVTALVDRLGGLAAAGLPMDVTLSCSDPRLAAGLRTALPAGLGVRTALVARAGCLPLAVLAQAVVSRHDELHPHISDLLADPGTVAAARSCGVDLVPWTVNSRRAVRHCADLGVAALVTDVPRSARAALATRAALAARGTVPLQVAR